MNKQELKKYDKMFYKIKYLIRTKNDDTDDYHKSYTEISFISNEYLPLEKH